MSSGLRLASGVVGTAHGGAGAVSGRAATVTGDAGLASGGADRADDLTAPGLVLQAATVHRDGRVICGPIDLSLTSGMRVAVTGCNGTGKSTLLALAAGLVNPDAGVVRRATGWRRVALCPQNAHASLLPWWSVARHLVAALQLEGASRRAATSAIGRFLADNRHALPGMDLVALARRRPGHLSGGEAQVVALLRALVVPAPVVLLDEPLSAIAAAARPAARALIRRLLAPTSIVMVVTHDREDVRELTSAELHLRSGAAGHWRPVLAKGAA